MAKLTSKQLQKRDASRDIGDELLQAVGNARFRERVEALSERQAAPKPRGGDRKSGRHRRDNGINRV